MANHIQNGADHRIADEVLLTGDACFGVDMRGDVIWTAAPLHGPVATGSPAADLFTPPSAAAFANGLRCARDGATVLLEVSLRGSDNRTELCTLSHPDADGVVMVELQPTSGGSARGWRRDEADALTVLSQVLADLSAGRAAEGGLDRALGHLVRLLEADRAVLAPAHPSASGPMAAWPPSAVSWPLPRRLLNAWLPRLRLDQLVHIPDTDGMGRAGAEAEEARLLGARGVRSILAAPASGGSAGSAVLDAFLVVESDHPRRWGPWAASLVRIVGAMVHAEIVRREEASARAGAAERLEAVMHHSASVLLVLDDEGGIGFVSSSLRRVLGWSPDQWIGRPLSRLVHPRDRHVLERALAPAQDGSGTLAEVRVPDEHARWRWMSVGIGGHVADSPEAGRVIHLHDVTDRVRLEAEERRLLEMVAATPDFIGTFTPQGALVSVNQAGLTMTGLFQDEAAGMPLSALFPEWARRRLTAQAIPGACAQGSWTGETAILDAAGREVPVSQVVLAHRDSTGEVAFLSTIMRDVSQQRAAEQLLRRHSLQLLTVAELGQRALRHRERDDLLREVLLAACAMFDAEQAVYVEAGRDGGAEVRIHDRDGVARPVRLPAALDELLGATQPAVLPDLRHDPVPASLAGLAGPHGGAAYAVVHGSQRPDGVLLVTSGEAGCLAPDDAHALESLAGLLSSAIERVEGEARLRQAERLEAVGRLAGGIAHDFNNLLTVILGNAESLDGDAAPAADEIRRAGASAARLAEQLLTFSRGKPSTDEVSDLRALTLEFESLLRRVIREDIELNVEVGDTGCPVRAGNHELEQILMNLVVNARDAISGRGRIDVLLDCGGDPATVRLRVRDNGRGIDDAVRSRIFEPYVTTKHNDGSGLGLATVHSIVEQAGGRISVESVTGAGTTFVVEMPMEDRRQGPRRGPVPQAESPPIGSARVMVVEDQAAIRSLVVESLRREGLDVIEAVNGAAAERLAQEQDWLDLVVTDVVMPEQNGPAMVETLRRRWPNLPVVYMSGYSGDEVPQSDQRAGFLQKPFSLADVRGAVWHFLGGPR